jgi:hypothetical protein
MYYCLYYWIFAPLRGGIVDRPDRLPSFAIDVVDLDRKTYQVGLYCDEEGHPHFARCRIPDLADRSIPEASLPLLQSIREHLLSVLRLTYRIDTMLAQPQSAWAFIENDKPPTVDLKVKELGGAKEFVAESAKDLFIHSYQIRELVRLYSDGVDPRIPLQYRYLSLYKILENKYRHHGHWNKLELSRLLARFSKEAAEAGVSGEVANTLHDLRDKCAHIKTGSSGKREMLGVTHLNLKEVSRVEKVLPLMRAACALVINERAEGKFELRTDVHLGQ